MKFLIDENLPERIACNLVHRGVDAVDLRNTKLVGCSDEELVIFARKEKRIIITANYKHFGNILLFPPKETPGIIVIKMPKLSISHVSNRIIDFITLTNKLKLRRKLTILEPARVRRKDFNI